MIDTKNLDIACKTCITFLVMLGMLIIAVIYDGMYIWVFLFVGGALVGVPIGIFFKGMNKDKNV